ncbi:MAG: sugar kinase [Acidobacteria bacterium]|nr:sugar kinase [Acidobacteriota bacterium]
MARYLIGIDNGSQSTKVSIFDEHGTVVCSAREPLRANDTPRPGIVEHPDDDIWDSIGKASRRAMAAFPGDRSELVGVGLCTIRFCRALLKSDGSLASPVMSWMDARVSRPYEHVDESVAYVTTSSGYVSQRMTGQYRDTAGNYQGVWPISTERWEWLCDDEGFSDFGLTRSMLFELVMPGDLIGRVTDEASRHTDIPAGIPVVATSNDKAVEALGCGLRSPNTLLVSLGTYIASMTVGVENRLDAASFWSNFASQPHQYLYESHGIRRGMWTVSWWRDLLGDEPFAKAKERGVSVEEYLDAGAEAVPPGCDGLMVTLDWLAPTDKPYRRGSMLGFDVRHGRFHIHRAIFEGIALTIYNRANAMARELGATFDTLVISGGGSNSDLFMQIFADVFGVSAIRTRENNAAGLGSAICAAVGLGVHSSWDEAIECMVFTEKSFAPDISNHVLYQKIAAIYDDIPAQTDVIFERSHLLSS